MRVGPDAPPEDLSDRAAVVVAVAGGLFCGMATRWWWCVVLGLVVAPPIAMACSERSPCQLLLSLLTFLHSKNQAHDISVLVGFGSSRFAVASSAS